MQIQPTEAWKLDILEFNCLFDLDKQPMDTSIMLNFERKINGADKKWLQSA